MGFSGSYDPQDVTFLLDPIDLAATHIEEKERLIASGQRHYSEMIGVERPPDETYLDLYQDALQVNGDRLARDIARLTHAIARAQPRGATLLSLARAGTPVGVLLRRALVALGYTTPHYSISIIRDRGIDCRALDHVRARHAPESWVFVDGWTGKGAIARELRSAAARYALSREIELTPTLAVVSDLAGLADLAATDQDYLIPSCILNSVVSGLVSRTILPREHDADRYFHRCVYYQQLAGVDRTREFVDTLSQKVRSALETEQEPAGPVSRTTRGTSEAFLAEMKLRWNIQDENRIKPGIGEATRALLRRAPARLLLRELYCSELRHIELLASRRGVRVEVDPGIPYRAVVLIGSPAGDA